MQTYFTRTSKSLLLSLAFLLGLSSIALAQSTDTGWLPLGSLECWNQAVINAMPERFLILGEMHGTEEGPTAALGLALTLREAGRPAVLALEWPTSLQDAADKEDFEKLKSEEFFQFADGRSSRAMVETIRRAHQEGLSVRFFDCGGATSAQRDQGMAETLLEIGHIQPEATVVVLVGNFHSRLNTSPDDPSAPPSLAMNLVKAGASLLTLRLTAETGEAWVVTSRGRGPQRAGTAQLEVKAPAFRRYGVPREGHNAEVHLPVFHAALPWADIPSDF